VRNKEKGGGEGGSIISGENEFYDKCFLLWFSHFWVILDKSLHKFFNFRKRAPEIHDVKIILILIRYF